jgi:hypothetical protein
VIILGMMQVSKKVPFDDPNVLMGVRILYVVSNLIIFGIYYYIGMKIKAKRGTLDSSQRRMRRGTDCSLQI